MLHFDMPVACTVWAADLLLPDIGALQHSTFLSPPAEGARFSDFNTEQLFGPLLIPLWPQA